MPDEALKLVAEVHDVLDRLNVANTNKDELLLVEISAHLAKQDVEGASQAFDASIKNHAGDESLLSTATQVFMNYGRYSNALTAIDQHLKLAPDNTGALLNKGL